MTFGMLVYAGLIYIGVVEFSGYLLVSLFAAELIDLDHLFSKPIYKKKRNPFKTHYFHKKWKYVLVIAAILMFVKPLFMLGVGLEAHLLLDFVYVKVNKL
jgi:hypothetical protein